MKKNHLFFAVFLLMSMLNLSCHYKRYTLVNLHYVFRNNTEHIIEIKNHWGNGQVDYYKIKPNKSISIDKKSTFPDAPKNKPKYFIEDYVDFDYISPFSSVEEEGYVEVIFDEEHISYHFLNRYNFELPDWYEDGKYYAPTDSRSLANKDAYSFDLYKRKKINSDFRYDVHYKFTEADYLEAVND